MTSPLRPGSDRSSSRSGRAPSRDRARSRRAGRHDPSRAAARFAAMNASSCPRAFGRHDAAVAREIRSTIPTSSAMNSWNSTSMRAVGREQVAVADACLQQPVDAVDPVLGECLGLDRGAAHAVAVREHRDRRLDHRHGIAVRDRERRVGERREQRRDLLEVLRRLQHPAVRAAQEREHLQDLLHVRVVRALVEREVVVAPARAHVRATRACTTRSRGPGARSPLRSRSGAGRASRAAAAPSASALRSRAGSA